MSFAIGLFAGVLIGFMIASVLCMAGDEERAKPKRKTRSVSSLRELLDAIDESEQTDRNIDKVDMAEDHWGR